MMNIRILMTSAGTAIGVTLLATSAHAQYAAQVVSYTAGSTASAGFTTAAAALGSPERFTGEGVFPSVVSPFSPPFLGSEVVSIGEGGQLTLRLSNYAVPQPTGLPELGVFGNLGLVDVAYPNGQAGTPASTFSPPGIAAVEVSQDGASWFNLGSTTFDVPTNGYTDLADPYSATAGNSPSDFQQPFVGSLSSFNGLPYSHPSNFDILDLLAGSGGGKWLDISSSGIAQVGYVRFSIADDGNPGISLRLNLDAISVSHAAFGASVPEPAGAVLAILSLASLVVSTRLGRARRTWQNRTAAQPN